MPEKPDSKKQPKKPDNAIRITPPRQAMTDQESPHPWVNHDWSRPMATTWTPERRQRQAAMIRQWRPWEKSTGPKTAAGKTRVSRNAYKGGTWRLLREALRVLKAQDRMLRELV